MAWSTSAHVALTGGGGRDGLSTSSTRDEQAWVVVPHGVHPRVSLLQGREEGGGAGPAPTDVQVCGYR